MYLVIISQHRKMPSLYVTPEPSIMLCQVGLSYKRKPESNILSSLRFPGLHVAHSRRHSRETREDGAACDGRGRKACCARADAQASFGFVFPVCVHTWMCARARTHAGPERRYLEILVKYLSFLVFPEDIIQETIKRKLSMELELV